MRNTETGEAPVYVHNVCASDMKRDAPEWEEVLDQRSANADPPFAKEVTK